MMRPVRTADRVEVVYPQPRWRLFKRLRERAKKLMLALQEKGIKSIVHGSVARGDVKENSDVDVVVLYQIPSYRVELALEEAGFRPLRREIVMATPWHLPKAQVYLDEDYLTTFPLLEPKPAELEFYHFGGALDLEQVEEGVRVAGVDKRLMLIEPTPQGHVESPIKGREAEVAKRLGVGLAIVRERVKVLTRRVDVGHTGIFVKRELAPHENFEGVFRELVKNNPSIRLRLKK